MTRLAIAGGVAVALALVGLASGATMVTTDDVRGWIGSLPVAAPVAFIGLFVALNTVGLPLPVLVAAGGSLFGAVEGSVITLVAMWAAACLQFLLARQVIGDDVRQQLALKLGRFSTILERRGILAVAAGRMLPGPFSELNMAAGLTSLRFRDFALGSALGCAPKAVAWTTLGALVS